MEGVEGLGDVQREEGEGSKFCVRALVLCSSAECGAGKRTEVAQHPP